MKKILLPAISGLLVCGSLMSGCGPDNTTDYRDFLDATGKVLYSDGVTPVANLAISAYQWVVTFTDKSTVAVDETPAAGVQTDTSGLFAFSSNQLALQSGTQVQSCTSVCTETSIGYDDVCDSYSTTYEDYCADWEESCGSDGSGSSGGSGGSSCTSYCADWETDSYETCDSSHVETYDYCSQYGQDCGWIYPSRSVTDIASAYSEITYALGASTVTTQSGASSAPAQALKTKSTVAGTATTVENRWLQDDQFISALDVTIAAPAATQARQKISAKTATADQLAERAKLTIAHNVAAGHVSKKLQLKYGFGRNHPVAKTVPAAQISSASPAFQKLDAIRKAMGAYDPSQISTK